MTSRLDRLLLLLDTGSSSSIRETAARQIAQIAAKNVAKDAGADIVAEWADVMKVVGKILPYLRSKSFETRTAATSALSHVCQMTPAWSPPIISPSDPSSSTTAPDFPPFSVEQLLKTGTLLLSSSGTEFSEPVPLGTPSEVARARKEAMNRIGLGFMDGVDDDDLGLEKELVQESETRSQSQMDIDVKQERSSSLVAMSDSEDVRMSSPRPVAKRARPPMKLDLETFVQPIKPEDLGSPAPTDTPMDESSDFDLSGLSARERNRLKRKRKLGGAAFVSALSNSTKASPSTATPASKVRVVPTGDGPQARPLESSPKANSPVDSPSGTLPPGEKVVVDPTKGGQVEAKEKAEEALALNAPDGCWVWGGVVEVLQIDLFSAKWEIRHGAAMALREIIRVRGASGGMKANTSSQDNLVLHEKWCNNLASKFLCLFVLDRFSDFVSDQVVAPVRETVSQTLAALLSHMPRRSVLHVHKALLEMIRVSASSPLKQAPPKATTRRGKAPANGDAKANGQGNEIAWQVRHAGLVGIKYEVAVRTDLFDDMEHGLDILQEVLDAAVSGMRDPVDDVRSVAATCITPIVHHVIERLSGYVDRILDVLWDCLGDMKDDLSLSVGFVMDLLGRLLSFDRIITSLIRSGVSRPLNQLIPLLHPFFRHTISNVRLSVVNTLHNFLSAPNFPDDWIDPPLMRLLMQNLVVEDRTDVRGVTLQVWRMCIAKLDASPPRLQMTVGPFIRDWFSLVMAPLGTPMDAALFYRPRSDADQGHNVDKNMLLQDLSLVSSETLLRARVVACKALAIALSVWPVEEQQELFGVFLEFYMDSASMLQQFLAATIVQEWAVEADSTKSSAAESKLVSASPLAFAMVTRFFKYLQSDPPSSYYEMYALLSRIANDCRGLFAQFVTDGKVPPAKIPELPAKVDAFGREQGGFTLSTANETVQSSFEMLKGHIAKSRKKELPALETKRKNIMFSIKQYQETKEQHDSRVAAAVAGALIALHTMPTKLNPVIRSVMNGVKFETNLDLQTRAAKSVAAFVSYSVASSSAKATPTDKIIKNLCTFICQDTDYTPVFAEMRNELDGILPKKLPASPPAKSNGGEETPAETSGVSLIRRGAELALGEVAAEFGESLFGTIPILWDCMVQPLVDSYCDGADHEKENGQNIVDCLTLLHALVPTFHPSLRPRVVGILPTVLSALKSQYAVIRRCAAQCFAAICNVFTEEAMKVVVEDVIPLLGDNTAVRHRQGAIEVIANIVQLLDSKVLPYLIFLIVPVLGRMSDSDDELRFIATNTFALLVKMVPLEAGLPDPPGFSEELLRKRENERAFLIQLLDGSKVEEYEIPVPIKAELRKYQQDGVNWLAFLAKYQLHGILCDDMGLGKTLQTICIVASRHHERKVKFRKTKSPDSTPLPSLIVCPPTLAGHWYHEILKYTESLKPMVYVGSVRERNKKASQIPHHDVVITSYDVVRNDLSVLSRHHWHYCVLDEGHVIKNAKAKLTKAVKSIQAFHRLILSGTPIQNNVLELWSLFDFLMPGFLGTESYFNEKFGRPISLSRDNRATPKIRDAAALALEALHKQVLPFLLRRLKEDVLNDLPPKIIQDYQCELSDLQKRLYDEYASSQARLSVENEIKKANGQKDGGGQKHVFQSLQYLRKLCNHPALVIKDPATLASLAEPGQSPPDLKDISNAPKLEALRQLLTDCGVGVASTSGKDNEVALDTSEAAISQHRVLIFCQMKQMLDIIENDLFQTLMPSVTYMRLDGTTDATKRHAVVETFNADPSIDCLLLTTHVGGLGLTLTGADTVIFVEHDWNPMKDLQAMDRAHRLGQKKVVNVYRLITKGTLEEKIMGLQRFKLNIANSVITQQNSGLASMDTDLVLDLFKRTTEEEDVSSKKQKQMDADRSVSQRNVLEGLEDLPPEDEYNFDFSAFLGSLGPSSQ
ncbi:uncharacterized protein EI90DRAFT_3051180 [Cantharellus anzutake]|uniref:uncharacterized protein n=1 Tax=Cantharellus anzutake TaxID=1750568 RepID=UPI0019051E07|nr:uncharacterized protein EI90DRAFT_3051180 [Cantharellus anzutake]KAF8334134.1 hypothetical protein EI90DRAFT_3051180 [Cantharellus anzutake]